ncbi:MAG: hypothetical protein ABWZ85_04985 [Luteibacter sp.]
MRDTIDLLEAIGRDASLRHASPDMLAELLATEGASGALRSAVALGDAAPLTDELGLIQMQTHQSTQFPGHDDDHDDDDKDDDDDDGDKDDDEDDEQPEHRSRMPDDLLSSSH